jgi:hypothetical protein
MFSSFKTREGFFEDIVKGAIRSAGSDANGRKIEGPKALITDWRAKGLASHQPSPSGWVW